MPVLRSISASQSSCRLLCHSNIRSCSLMCLALSQHHTALALSCALLCLSITLLLLSHVPCFVSASRCSCSLMYLALSQHHAALALSCALLCLSITLHSISCRSYSHVPSFVSVLLSQVLCFVSASLTPFLLSLMCLICLVTVLVHVHCFVSTSRRSYVVSGYHAARCLALSGSASRLVLSQVLRLSITPLMCLALSQHDITPVTPLFSALPFPLDIFPGYCSTLLQSCPMN